ncbi:hypothetical protein BDR03DRAFT_745524 [Suillus americanus]|nr:hypothetical protein BDR03DRAFT_745524 [Suillus americanus]
MSRFNRPARTSPPFDSLTSSNPEARRFPSPVRADTGTSGVAANTSGSAADTLGYPFNTFAYPVYLNGYIGSNVSSTGNFPYRSEGATTTHSVMDDIARSQKYYPTADFIHYDSDSYDIKIPMPYPVTYELQPNSGYGNPVHNAVQGGVNAWYPGTPVTGGNPPPSYIPPVQYLDGYRYTPYPPQYASPNTHASSSSYRAPSSYPESSAHYPEAYHGSWPQCEYPAICDPQAAGFSSPEQPGPSMALLPSAAIFSHPYIGHGDDIRNPSHRPPSIQPHQDLPPNRNSRSRQNSRRRRRSHPYGTHHSPSTATFSCGWLVRENTTCGFEGLLDAFKMHFRRSHLSGAQDAPNVCCWRGCKYRKRDNADICVMRRDNVWRHVWETHLGMKRNV